MSVFFKPVTASPMDRVPMEGLAGAATDWGSLTTSSTPTPWSNAVIFDKAFSFFSKYGAVKAALLANADRLTQQEAINVVAYLLRQQSVPAQVVSGFQKLPPNAKTVLYGMIQAEGDRIPKASGTFLKEAIDSLNANTDGGAGDTPEKARDLAREKECDLLRVDSLGVCWTKRSLWKYGLGAVAVLAAGVVAMRYLRGPAVVVTAGGGGVKGLPRGGKKRKAKRAKK